MSINNKYPNISPSLNLDFTNSNTIDPRITFSRASVATYYDGKTVAKAEENLLTYSQEFDNAAWSKQSSAVTSNSIAAPDGTVTADTLTANSGVGVSPRTSQAKSVQPSIACTASVYLRAGTAQFATVALLGAISTSAWYSATVDLSTGVITQATNGGSASSVSYVISNAGGGWYRVQVSAICGSETSISLAVHISNTGTPVQGAYSLLSWSPVGTESVYLWGAQLEQRSQVTAYTPTTTQPITNYIPVLQTAPAGVPRFDHNPVTGESLGLLVEEQRTNLLTYSEQFGNAAFTKASASVQNNEVVAPDGTFTADKMIESVGVSTHFVSSITTLSAGGTYTLSVYVKAAGRNTLSLQFVNGSAGTNCFFDLASGTNTANNTFGGYGGSVGTPTITHVGNGWYRCSTTVTIDSTAVQSIRIGTTASNGDGYSGLYIWGAQLEAGSFPTSYIKTEASQVTRAADSASMTGANFSSWYRQDEGTLFTDSKSFGPATVSGTGTAFSVTDGTINNRIRIGNYITGGISYSDIATAGVVQASWSTTVAVDNYLKSIIAYKFNDIAAVFNAGAVQLDNSANIPIVLQCQIGNAETGRNLNGHIKRITYYPKRLTAAQLQALTA